MSDVYRACPDCGDKHPKGAIYCKKFSKASKSDLEKAVSKIAVEGAKKILRTPPEKSDNPTIAELRAELKAAYERIAELEKPEFDRGAYMREYMRKKRLAERSKS